MGSMLDGFVALSGLLAMNEPASIPGDALAAATIGYRSPN